MKRLSPWIGILLLWPGMAKDAAAADFGGSSEHLQFRTPGSVTYWIDTGDTLRAGGSSTVEWLPARLSGQSTNSAELGSRVVLQLKSPDSLKDLIASGPLRVSRTIGSNVFILQGPDALVAAREAHRLAGLPEVLASYPVLRRAAGLHGPYAARSNDPFFVPYFNANPSYDALWPWENRDYNGTRLGIDLNVLAAWPFGLGAGVTVAVVDTGLEMNHPELVPRLAGSPSFNFDAQTTNAGPYGGDVFDPNRSFWTHGTSVGGLIAAEGNNGRGMVGIAPQANLASWLIFTTNLALISDERLMEMYQFASDAVAVQNHSWGAGNGVVEQVGPTLLENIGIQNAVTLGRQGLGTVMVRSVGNDRVLLARADDDAYPNSPDVVAVAAVTKSGRVTSYSEPGACILVGAPGGGDAGQGLFTLDLVGNRGVSTIFFGEINDYRWGALGFSGTSASAPLVSGVAALILSVNPALSYRDVQQILLLSARHGDRSDPDLVTNGAGLLVSHNVGYGVPDAAHAVWLADLWQNRPPLTTVSVSDHQPLAIPDDGLRVQMTGLGVPAALGSIRGRPGIGLHADTPTAQLELVDIGLATNVPAINLTNRAALILRGTNDFKDKIANAAAAGAAFAVIYNYSTNVDAVLGGDQLTVMGQTDFAPIPAVFIGHGDGEALKALIGTNAFARARIHLESADRLFPISSPMICEHVGVRVRTDHPQRSDLRITLLSPQGTRSVLQQYNTDAGPGPTDWTYWSTHHFFEGSAGVWKVSVSDESAGATGSVLSVSLIVRGAQIQDVDHDGLDDGWESANLGSLGFDAKDDPDGDGFSNAREQVMGGNPAAADRPFRPELSWWELAGYRLTRVTWPSAPQYTYSLFSGTNIQSLNLLTNLPAGFPETEWLGPWDGGPGSQFYQLYSMPNP